MTNALRVEENLQLLDQIRRVRTLFFAACLGLVLLACPAWSAPQQAGASAVGQALHVFVGKSVLINTQAPTVRVLSSNPAAIETLATSPTQIVVEGKAAGTSSLILWDAAGNSQMLDVAVDVDVSALRTAIEHAYPKAQIDVQSDGQRLILTGSAPSSKVSDDVVKMAAIYSPQVVNSMSVPLTHEREVLLEVKFAEVDRNAMTQFGVNLMSLPGSNMVGATSTGAFSAPTFAGTVPPVTTATSTATATTVTNGAGFTLNSLLNIFLYRPDLNLAATIQALESQSVLEILAEPNLLAMNGQKASFLSGGQFPYPTVQGGANVGAVNIQFRPFGVRLDFTADIEDDGVIHLHVAPEVSTLDFANAVTIQGFTMPALSTRSAETDLELKDGQSFGIAGLLDKRDQTQLSKIPGIGDIPILGQLFRSKTLNKSDTELLVLVTPHIVDPLAAATTPAEPKFPVPFLDAPKFDSGLPGSKSAPAAAK